jgi:glycosyltransferase involved in cell wall biosynthesis
LIELNKIIYTAIVGNYDDLKNPHNITPGWRYICVTDDVHLHSDIWEVIHVKNENQSNKRLARKIKIKPQDFLPPYDICVWIDGSIQINCDLNLFISDIKADFSILKHHIRSSILDEAEICKAICKDDPDVIDRQMEFYRSDNYQFNNGLVESGLMIRTNAPQVTEFCNLWYEQVDKFSIRDQLSFNYVLYKYPIELNLLDYAILHKEFILNNHQTVLGKRIKNPLKVIITGMEHSGTLLLSRLIIENSILINSGSECGVLLSESPRKFREIEPFYEWFCEESHGWALTKELREYICDTDSFADFYARLVRTCTLFSKGEPYILDQTPAYSYYLFNIVKRAAGVPILIVLQDIERLWCAYKERNFTFEEFIERYMRFKTSVLDVLPNKNIKIIGFNEIVGEDIKKIEEIFSLIDLPLEKKKLQLDDLKNAAPNYFYSAEHVSESIDKEQKSILNEIKIKASPELNIKGPFLENERKQLSLQTKRFEKVINEVRANQIKLFKLKNIQVSVIIPNYNYSCYLEECVNSVINSDFPKEKLEIVIIDDASTDNSIQVVERIVKRTEVRINLLSNKTNIGLAKSRNLAINNALGGFLFFLDADNYLAKDCLKKHFEFLSANAGFTACYAPIQRFDNETRNNLTLVSDAPYDYHRLADGNYIDAMSMIRKKDLLEIGMYDEKMPASGWEDYELWLRMGKANKQVQLLEGPPLSYYRVHADSMINNVSGLYYEFLITYLRSKYPINEKKLKWLFCRYEEASRYVESSNSLNEVFVQLLYSQNEAEFTDEHSLKQGVHIKNNNVNISFILPAQSDALKFIRLNVDYFAGLIIIDSVKIKTQKGDLLQFLDSDAVFEKINATFGMDAMESNAPIKAFTNPKLNIPLNEEVQQHAHEELVIDFVVTGIGPSEVEAFNKLSAILFSQTGKQLKKIERSFTALVEANKVLSGELALTKADIKTVNSERTLLTQNLSNKETIIDRIEKENLMLTNDKAFLLSEINEKNERLDKTIAEKAHWDKMLLSKEKEISALDGQLVNSKQLILQAEKDIFKLENEKSSFLKEIENFQVKLIQNEDRLQKKSEQLNHLEKTLIVKEYAISDLQKEKANLEIVLNESTVNTSEKAGRIHYLERELETQIETMQNVCRMKDEKYFADLEKVKNELRWYKNAYEQKPLHSILKDRLIKLKSLQFSKWNINQNKIINSLFDAVYYLETNPDVKKAGIKPIRHYLTAGWKENRNPHPLFDVDYYFQANPDVKEAEVEPLQHYLMFGWKERRNPHPLFDVSYYLEVYPDVEKSGMEPLHHYLYHGWREGRNPSENFDTLFYLTKYVEVQKIGICPLVHYVRFGNKENLSMNAMNPPEKISQELDFQHIQDIEFIPNESQDINDVNLTLENQWEREYSKEELVIKKSEFFDEAWYVSTYKLDDAQDPARHYLFEGWKTLCNPSERFSTVQYLILNKDVETAGINPLLHYEVYGKNEKNRIYYEPHVIDFNLNNEYKRQQDNYLSSHYSKSTKKLIVYLLPELDLISGGVMSICSMARVTKDIEELSDSTVLVATLPSVTTFFQYTKFDAGFNVLRFDQLRDYFNELEDMVIHIPEIYVYYFLLKIKPADTDWFRGLKKNQINILNQNMALMPRLKIVEYLKLFGSTTITCAHKRYCKKQLRSSYDVPVHFFSTSNLIKYKYRPYREKENIIAYSPDDNPFKDDILSLLKKELPDYEFVEIRNMSYDQYLSTITKVKWMITFGEGIDGYFMESIRSGSIAFSVKNHLFFEEVFNDYSNIYESYFDMLGNIVADMKRLDNENEYNSFNKDLRLLDAKVYNDEEYKNNIRNYYLGNYTFPIEEVHIQRAKRKERKPLISVVMATYNGETYLKKQLDSLIAQTYDNVEIIVSDDNSTDSTLKILQQYKEKHGITVVSNTKKNKGLNGNFSNGLLLAKGEYISLCDQDDIWQPNKLEILLERIDDFDIVQGQMIVIDEQDAYHPAQYMHDAYETDKTSLYNIENYIKENPMLGCATLITKKCIEKSLPMPEGFVYHDWWIALNAILKGNGICNVDIPVINYRQHSTNTAKSNFWSSSWCTKKYTSDKIILKDLKSYLNPAAKHLLECDMNLMLLYGFARKFAPKLSFEYFDNNSTAFSNRVMEELLESINIKEENVKYEK